MLRLTSMVNNHNFHSNFSIDAYSSTRELWDKPLFESESFVALPTVGALLKGWLLLVPRQPLISMAKLSKPMFSEMNEFLNDVASALENVYGPVAIFEHGASEQTSQIGCGVDHAHMHLVPTSIHLLAEAKLVTSNVQWNNVPNIADIRDYSQIPNGYWFLQQDHKNGSKYIGTCTDNMPVSQLFRRAIANALGKPTLYDWKQSLGKDTIIDTVVRLSQHSFSYE